MSEYEIAIKCSHFSIKVYQGERYSRLVVGVVEFEGGPSAHWQEVRAALPSATFVAAVAATTEPTSDEAARNDEFVRELREFCEERFVELLEWPPRWLQDACKVVEQNLKRHFPDMAKQYAQECADYVRRISG